MKKKPQWYLVYFALAAFDVVTILLSLYLNHAIVENFTRSVQVNQEWMIRLDKFARLSVLAGKVNAPGNDVFDSKDASAELLRMELAKSNFYANLEQLTHEIRTSVNPTEAAPILAQLNEVNLAMKGMTDEADQIFTFFRDQKPESAGERMATMDRKFANLNEKIASLNSQIRRIQSYHLAQQEQLSKNLVYYEYFIVIAVIFIVIAVAVYGRKLAMTMLKTQEDLMKANQEVMVASKAKENFLANMSHEIRTPMNAILGFTDLLSQTKLDEKQQEYIKTIKSSGDLLISIINDILDFSKLEAGKVKLEAVNFNLEYLVSDVFKMISSRLVDKKIHTFIDLDPRIPVFLIGDPTRMRQILINLLGNAIKFTEQGEIGIIIRQDIEKSTPEEPMLHFIVRDTGIGISPEGITKLFQAFSQADDSTTRKFGGTGLGLTISKNLVGLMGGNMWVDSVEGKGSDFVFNLKFKKGQALEEQQINPLSLSALKQKRVMIIDDNAHANELLKRYCKALEMNVVAVLSNPQEALQTLKKLAEGGQMPEVILSDIMMPQMDGYDLAQLIRKNQQYDAIKIVAVSSDIRMGIMDKLKQSGFNGFLPKPITRDELAKVIATVFGDQRTQGPIVNRHMAEEFSVKGVKVLLVEDVKANQDLMKAFFNIMGCVGDYASNGQEAIDKVKSNVYDLCLMDVQMPVMGGIEATKIIRADINKDIPIIALTANVMAEDQKKCFDAGMNDYLPKPIDIKKLKEKIKQYSVKV